MPTFRFAYRTFEVNTFGTINLTRMVVRNLVSRKVPGSIVNISSQASMIGLVDHGTYCASKGAVDGFTRCMAVELGSHGIRVNAVNPTVIMTKLGREVWKDPVAAKKMADSIPLGRLVLSRQTRLQKKVTLVRVHQSKPKVSYSPFA